MKTRHYVSFLLTVLLIGCKSEKEIELKPLSAKFADNGTSITIDKEIPYFPVNKNVKTVITVPQPKEFSLTDIVEEYEFIPLETKDKGLIGKINQICMDSTFIFILDEDNNSIFSFSNKGKFLSRIGSKGRGPKEYTGSRRIALDTIQKELCVLDQNGWKLEYYAYNGTHLRSVPMYFLFSDIAYLKDKILTFTMRGQNKKFSEVVDSREVLMCDKTFKPIARMLAQPKDMNKDFIYAAVKPLKTFFDGIYYCNMYSDTIWRVNNKSCDAMFLLDFPQRGHLIDPKDYKNLTNERYGLLIDEKDAFLGECFITPNYAYFSISDIKNECILPLIYNRRTKHTVYGRISYLSKSRLGDYFFSGIGFVGKEDQFIRAVQPYRMIEYYEGFNKERLDKLTAEEKAFMQTITEEDNPVLMIIKMKNF